MLYTGFCRTWQAVSSRLQEESLSARNTRYRSFRRHSRPPWRSAAQPWLQVTGDASWIPLGSSKRWLKRKWALVSRGTGVKRMMRFPKMLLFRNVHAGLRARPRCSRASSRMLCYGPRRTEGGAALGDQLALPWAMTASHFSNSLRKKGSPSVSTSIRPSTSYVSRSS